MPTSSPNAPLMEKIWQKAGKLDIEAMGLAIYAM
jgi:hypothetical protein